MRAVLDVNIIVSGALSANGAPAEILRRWVAGEFELITSDKLLAELSSTLAYPKIRKRIDAHQAASLVELLARGSVVLDDPSQPPRVSTDPGDDYLVALARSAQALLVSGDTDVLALTDSMPFFGAREFLAWLDGGVKQS